MVKCLCERKKPFYWVERQNMRKYIDIQNDAIKRYNITLCHGELCPPGDDWPRTHAHIKERRICKWVQKNSIQSTFILLHEIGHIETTKSKHRCCEAEYYATQWALDVAKNVYGLDIPISEIRFYQSYIKMEYDRGIRRGGRLPDYKNFILKVGA